jgi:hypothetical protein
MLLCDFASLSRLSIMISVVRNFLFLKSFRRMTTAGVRTKPVYGPDYNIAVRLWSTGLGHQRLLSGFARLDIILAASYHERLQNLLF